MKRFRIVSRIPVGMMAGAAVLCSLPMLAATPVQLNVKTGLWESTITTKAQGSMIPESYLEQLTPEQRARAEAAMKQAQKPHTSRSCMTREKMMQDFAKNDSKDCKVTTVTNTSKTLEYRVICSSSGSNGPESSSTMIHLDAVTPELVQGKMQYQVSQNGKEVTQGDGNFTSKWISSSCGNVK